MQSQPADNAATENEQPVTEHSVPSDFNVTEFDAERAAHPLFFNTGALINMIRTLPGGVKRADPPWGIMKSLNFADADLTIKHLQVFSSARTSLQYHEKKHEVIVVLSGHYDTGFVETGPDAGHLTVRRDGIIEIQPSVVHRVTGPLEYLEISTYDDGEDVIRISDDYGRANDA